GVRPGDRRPVGDLRPCRCACGGARREGHHDRRQPRRRRTGGRNSLPLRSRSMPVRRSAAPEPLGLAAALVPVVALVGLLGLSFYLFGDAAAGGPNQIALVFCSILATLVAWRHGHSVEALRDA